MDGNGWKRAHGELTRLAKLRAGHDAEEARWLVEGKRHRVHARIGCATYIEYLERVLGYPPRQAREKLRVAEALDALPDVRDALARGELSWSAVREVTRVAVPETSGAWLAASIGRTVREVEDLVAGRRPGDRPGDPPDPDAIRHVLRLELSAGTMAAFRDARRALEDGAGHGLDDDELIRLLAHQALGGPGDPGRAAYQVAMTLCGACGRAAREGAGRSHPVVAAEADTAMCDAQLVSATPVGRGVPSATQTIPPRIRRAVFRRDEGRCRVPGCRASRFLEVHHIVPRSRGGTHDPANLVLLCSAHHGRIHDGSLRLSGRAPDHLAWRNAVERDRLRGEVGRAPGGRRTAPCVDPRGRDAADASAPPTDASAASMADDATEALRRMGIQAGHARDAVAEAVAARPATLEDLLRRALSVLYGRVYRDRFAVSNGERSRAEAAR